MPKAFEGAEPNLSEIDTLRREVARFKDIEQRCQKANAALKAIEERNRLLGDSTPLGIFTIDDQGGITGINRKMLEIFAWPSVDDPTSMNLFGYQTLAGSGIVTDFQRCIAQNKPIIAEHPYIDPQGYCIHLRYHLSPIPGINGAISGVMAIVEDNTDLKKTEEALRESEKRYRQLFQSAPFALIEWDVSLLKAYLEKLRASDVTNFREYLEGNPREVHHCWSLIKTVNYNQAFLKLMGVADSTGPGSDFIPTDAEGFLRMAREIILVAARKYRRGTRRNHRDHNGRDQNRLGEVPGRLRPRRYPGTRGDCHGGHLPTQKGGRGVAGERATLSGSGPAGRVDRSLQPTLCTSGSPYGLTVQKTRIPDFCDIHGPGPFQDDR